MLLALGVGLVAAVMAVAVMFGGQSMRLALGLAVIALLFAGLAVWQGIAGSRLANIGILWGYLPLAYWCILSYLPVLCRSYRAYI